MSVYTHPFAIYNTLSPSFFHRYLDLGAAAETHGQWSLEYVEPREFVRLDASAL